MELKNNNIFYLKEINNYIKQDNELENRTIELMIYLVEFRNSEFVEIYYFEMYKDNFLIRGLNSWGVGIELMVNFREFIIVDINKVLQKNYWVCKNEKELIDNLEWILD